MPLAVTHVILTMILVDLYRNYITKHKRYFSLHTVFIAGLAGLLPDIDVPLNWVFDFFGYSFSLLKHGGITHTPLLGLIFLVPAFYFLRKKKHKMAVYFFVICFGILFHLFLDFLLGGGSWEGVMFFWPLSTCSFKIHLFSKLGLSNIPMAVDALILLAWLYHEEIKHKIKDFI